jgi:hypothetical protein
MTEFKKCECLACGNIFPSKANKIKCRNGAKLGCGSTKTIVLEVKKSYSEQIQEDQEEPQNEEEEQNGWF